MKPWGGPRSLGWSHPLISYQLLGRFVRMQLHVTLASGQHQSFTVTPYMRVGDLRGLAQKAPGRVVRVGVGDFFCDLPVAHPCHGG